MAKTICKELQNYDIDGKYMLTIDGKTITNTDYLEPQRGSMLVGVGRRILLFTTEAEMLTYIETNNLTSNADIIR